MKRIGCIFSGQGSQYLGMGKDLYESFPVARQMFDRANSVLGFDIARLCFDGPEAAMLQTKNQQLGIVVVSAVCFELIRNKISPSVCAGLSLGEYTAVWAAGVFSFEDLLVLVKERASAMQEAAVNNPSAMVAVTDVPLEKIEAICTAIGRAYPANINSPVQVVVSVAKEKTDEWISRFNQLGIGRTTVLNVGGGFHSPFMKSAGERLKKALFAVEFKNAAVPIISNVDAQEYRDGARIRENLIEQLTNKVLWKDSLDRIFGLADELYEIGPSRILRGLLRKFERKKEVRTVGKKEEIEEVLCGSRIK